MPGILPRQNECMLNRRGQKEVEERAIEAAHKVSCCPPSVEKREWQKFDMSSLESRSRLWRLNSQCGLVGLAEVG